MWFECSTRLCIETYSLEEQVSSREVCLQLLQEYYEETVRGQAFIDEFKDIQTIVCAPPPAESDSQTTSVTTTTTPTTTVSPTPTMSPSPTTPPFIEYRPLDPRKIVEVPIRYTNVDFGECFTVLNTQYQECGRDFTNLNNQWVQCASAACNLYSGESESLTGCNDLVKQYEVILNAANHEFDAVQNYACYGWWDQALRWDGSIVLYGGYKTALFGECYNQLETCYSTCASSQNYCDNDVYGYCMRQKCEQQLNHQTSDFGQACEARRQSNVNALFSSFAHGAAQQEANCGGGETNPCNNDYTCQTANGETYDNCKSDCDGVAGYWTSNYNTNLQLVKGFVSVDFSSCLAELDKCFAGCSPYEWLTMYDCATNIKNCYIHQCTQTYSADPHLADCLKHKDHTYNNVFSANGDTAYSNGRASGGCSSTGTTCGGNTCSAGASCCSYQGNQVCSDSYGQCPQEGNQCGSGYCNIGETCCNSASGLCSIGGVCPSECGLNLCYGTEYCCDSISSRCSSGGSCYQNTGTQCGSNFCSSGEYCCDYSSGTCSVGNSCSTNTGTQCGFTTCSVGESCCDPTYSRCSSGGSCNTETQCGTTYCSIGEHCCDSANSICSSSGSCNAQGSCNNNGICEEGETQEGCATDCPFGCNRNGKCETENGEDATSCPDDCKSGGDSDYSTMTWTSSWNSAFTVQQGYGYLANWYSCLSDVETCWAGSCGADFNTCLSSYPVCARITCNPYGSTERTTCIDTAMGIFGSIPSNENANWAYGNAQANICGPVRRLAEKSSLRRRGR